MAKKAKTKKVNVMQAVPSLEDLNAPDPIDEQLAANALEDAETAALEADAIPPPEDPVFRDDAVPETGPFDDHEARPPLTAIPNTNFFAEAREEDRVGAERRKQDTLIGLLIGTKNLVKLRAFGYDVVVTGVPAVPGSAHMGQAQ